MPCHQNTSERVQVLLLAAPSPLLVLQLVYVIGNIIVEVVIAVRHIAAAGIVDP